MAALRRLLVTGPLRRGPLPPPLRGRIRAAGRGFAAALHADPASCTPNTVLWDRSKLVNRVLLRASMGSGEQLVTVSQASYDALPGPLRQRATTVVHGVDLSQSDSLVARRAELRALVRSELGAGRGRAALHDRGQPPPREGLRRAARCGEGPSRIASSRSGSPRWDAARCATPSARVTTNWVSGTGSSSSASVTTSCSCWRAPTPSSWRLVTRGFPWR